MTVVTTILAKNFGTDILSMYICSVERCHSLVKVDHPWQPGNRWASCCLQRNKTLASLMHHLNSNWIWAGHIISKWLDAKTEFFLQGVHFQNKRFSILTVFVCAFRLQSLRIDISTIAQMCARTVHAWIQTCGKQSFLMKEGDPKAQLLNFLPPPSPALGPLAAVLAVIAPPHLHTHLSGFC